MLHCTHGIAAGHFSSAAFADIGLILHPDDVGKPRVLHQLTPVVAARGHWDSAAQTSRAAKPEHSNAQGFPVAQSFRSASRRDGVVKRGRMGHLMAHAQAAGASIVVYGHTHIPMVTLYQGVWVINPSALASGTVAHMRLTPGVPPEVTHWGLGETPRSVNVSLDWSAGFTAALRRYSSSILDADLGRVEAAVRQTFSPDVPHAEQLNAAYLRVAHQMWAGEVPLISWHMLERELRVNPLIAQVLNQHLGRRLGGEG
ncbi:metallophosphoesterase family protein [Deinococcus sp. YIM 134068]|uniref:metallophosphoesterase family protein n=1 Tax=Deinococcus lichenicola TaxID=3118910 RepID=UPI003FA47828